MGIQTLEHDHTQLTRALADLRTRAKVDDPRFLDERFLADLRDLAEHLLEHFAREEEALFPFVSEKAPARAAHVAELLASHDRICGVAARLASLGPRSPSIELARSLFERFDTEYTAHAMRELEFLRSIASELSAEDHARLGELLAAI